MLANFELSLETTCSVLNGSERIKEADRVLSWWEEEEEFGRNADSVQKVSVYEKRLPIFPFS